MAVKLTLEEMSGREIWGEERSYVWLKRDDARGTGLIKNSAPTSLQNEPEGFVHKMMRFTDLEAQLFKK